MTLPALNIRPSTEDDIGAVHQIYEHEVLTGTATFDEVPPTLDEIRLKREGILKLGYPFLVAEIDGAVAAYGYVMPYRERSAYSKTVENAIYVSPNHRIAGIGSALMSAVINECAKVGIKNIIAVIGDSENLASIKLHKKLGYRKVGTLREVGFKFGRMVDVVLMQKQLD